MMVARTMYLHPPFDDRAAQKGRSLMIVQLFDTAGELPTGWDLSTSGD